MKSSSRLMEYKITQAYLYSFSDINEPQVPDRRNRILNLLDNNDFELYTLYGIRIDLDKKHLKYKYISTTKKVSSMSAPIYYFLYEFYWNEEDSKLDITKYSNINILKIGKYNTFLSLPITNTDRQIKYRNKKLLKIKV